MTKWFLITYQERETWRLLVVAGRVAAVCPPLASVAIGDVWAEVRIRVLAWERTFVTELDQ